MSSDEPATRRSRLRVARGPKRPDYLGNPDLDRVMMMMTALIGEVSALRDRVDTHERLADLGTMPARHAVESFAAPSEVVQARTQQREAMLQRVYRVLFEELERARLKEAEGAGE